MPPKRCGVDSTPGHDWTVAAICSPVLIVIQARPPPRRSPEAIGPSTLVAMPERRSFDAVVVGGGHNALVAATLLARAGRSVLVLERRAELGGAAASAQVFPGFDAQVSRYSYLVSLFPASLARTLGVRVELRIRRVAAYPAARARSSVADSWSGSPSGYSGRSPSRFAPVRTCAVSSATIRSGRRCSRRRCPRCSSGPSTPTSCGGRS